MTQMRPLRTITLGICLIMGEMVMGLIIHIPLVILLIPCHHLLPREPGLRIILPGSPPCLLNLLLLLRTPLILLLALLQGHPSL